MKVYINRGMAFDLEGHVKNARVVRVPSLDTRVGDRALRELRGVRKLLLPSGLEVVGESWFTGCDIERAVVPASVREIRANAFGDCSRLR